MRCDVGAQKIDSCRLGLRTYRILQLYKVLLSSNPSIACIFSISVLRVVKQQGCVSIAGRTCVEPNMDPYTSNARVTPSLLADETT
jgi:hypothetical protein